MPKKPLPQFVPPMQASSVKEPFDSTDWIFETKLDGYWAVAVIGSGGNARIWSCNHLPLEPKFPTVREAVNQLRLRSTILDGEIVALDEEGIPRFQLLQKWQKRRRLADRRNRLSFLGQTLRILLAPFQRLPDDFVFRPSPLSVKRRRILPYQSSVERIQNASDSVLRRYHSTRSNK